MTDGHICLQYVVILGLHLQIKTVANTEDQRQLPKQYSQAFLQKPNLLIVNIHSGHMFSAVTHNCPGRHDRSDVHTALPYMGLLFPDIHQ